LPPLSKIFEAVFKKRMNRFVAANSILSKSQYGYVNKSNTQAAVSDVVTAIQEGLDGKKSAAAVFIDLPKAFDTVDHVVLLKKCNSLGMRRIPLKWLRSYLSNRQQYVFVNNTSSTVKSITSGVPQGSILGPFLFSLYINDLDELNLQGNLHLYADDICLIYMGESREEIAQKMQFDLDALHVYMSAHRLSININKTKLMVFTGTGPFTRGGTDISVTIGGS